MDEIVFANLDRWCSIILRGSFPPSPLPFLIPSPPLTTTDKQSFFGAMGCISAIVFTVLGSSYGTAKSSAAIFSAGVLRPDRLMQNTLCAIMAQILSIYGLVAAVIIANRLVEKQALHTSFLQFAAGISVGLCGLAAGFAIGIVGDAGVRATNQQPRLYTGMVLILIFAEVLGLYGLIVSILLLSTSQTQVTDCSGS
ncbi:V-type ATPase [Colletotrichum abscissum]|uniref:V-type proton ATPase proteolipid subunit n=1 Tax=Colletotrichum abscissum TaxID=1671311 RepID=A0A9Q0B9W4_9PEZI|nr:V-type ATPase [Colletotrichum abscissum]KAI3559429.1 V-type ATPase [Colletotrichum abscissum]KAK1525429.1 V-type ATPase [Colletotrichum abscissum]